MSGSRGVILRLVFGAVLALVISSWFAVAQTTDRDSTWAVLDVVATINTAIGESTNSAELREKTVRRLAECSLMYGGLSTLSQNVETKKNYVQAQLATSEVEAAIAKPLENAKRLELENGARISVATIMRGIKTQGDKEAGPLVKNCKALNDVRTIKNTLQELPPR